MSVGIVVKQYEGWNRAMGKYITSRKHYEKEMIAGGYVTFKEGQRLAEETQRRMRKPYNELSPKAITLIQSARLSADTKGNLKCSDRLIDGMKEVGVSFNEQHCPKHYQPEGGFSQ